MDKITVVCHKDHDRGYEDFQGKCLLCVVDELMLEMGNLMIQKQRAEKREWVGLTADEIWQCNKASGSAVEFHICYEHQNVLDFAESLEAKLREKNHG